MRGVVVDPAGAPVPGAVVALSVAGASREVTTEASGRFEIAFVSGPTASTGELTIRAAGFTTLRRPVDLAKPDLGTLALALATKTEDVVVTAGRSAGRLADTAASVTLLDASGLKDTAAPSLDDALRQVPGFSLFRRTGSRTANPTSQGVSLRGVGASGASRAAVLLDGVPLSDPFGGWIYWTSVPRLSLDRVEVVRGGGSSLYGSDALGGVVSLVSRADEKSALAAEGSYGGAATANGSLFASTRVAGFGVRAAAEGSRTDGVYIVDAPQRGAVDTRAQADFGTGSLLIDRRVGGASRVFARGSYFSEARNNGTTLQTNDTRVRSLATGADRASTRGAASLRVFVSSQDYNQTFTSISAARATEALIRRQRTPARQYGFTSQISRAFGAHTVVAGVDARVVRGFSNETAITAGRTTALVEAGGEARSGGVFAQDTVTLGSRTLLTVGARADTWRHRDGRSITTTVSTGARTGGPFAERSETAFDPRIALLFHAKPGLSFTASAYRGFRAPTLNELYRSFRVGSVSTLANATLRAETLQGAEAGVSYEAFDRRVRLRATAFASRTEDPIVNSTLTVTPDLTTRQRQNLGANTSRGLEAEAQADVSPSVSLTASYLFTRARVDEAPNNKALVGLDLPQTPRHQATLQLRWAAKDGTRVALQARAGGAQFDDDLNLLPLGGYAIVDLLASRPLRRDRLDVFVAVENALDARYETGRSGVTTIGAPRSARAGLRLGLR